MKTIVRILIGLIVILAVIFAIGFFLPKDVTVTSQISINASPQLVYEQVNTPKNWKLWSPWSSMDTTLEFTYEGPENGVGAVYKWTSNKFGEGKWTMMSGNEYTSIESEMDFGEQGKIKGWWKFEPDGKRTMITWGIENKNMGYAERYFTLLMKKNMVETLQSGLENLKNLSEELRLDRISKVQKVDLEERMAFSIKDSTTKDSLYLVVKNLRDMLKNHAGKYNIDISGDVFVIYHTWDTTGYSQIETGLPVDKKVYVSKNLEYKIFPPTKALCVSHWGIPEFTKAHQALNEYIKENDLEETGPRWEEYVTDIKTEADTSKWLTKIYTSVQTNNTE